MGLEPINPTPSEQRSLGSTPPSFATLRLLHPEPFSQRIQRCRERFLEEDGRFTPQQIMNISGSSDGFDENSLHLVSGPPMEETGLLRITVVSPLADKEPRLPFQHFYPEFNQPLRVADAEISRFLVAPGSRKGRSTSFLIEAAFRLCATEGVDRLFIDVVDGDLGIAPKSYSKHYGFRFTGATGYDDNYSCKSHLMVLEGADGIREIAERLTRRLF